MKDFLLSITTIAILLLMGVLFINEADRQIKEIIDETTETRYLSGPVN